MTTAGLHAEALKAAIRAITEDRVDAKGCDIPNGPTEEALSRIEALSESTGKAFPRELNGLFAELCESMADDIKRLRVAAERYFGEPFGHSSEPAEPTHVDDFIDDPTGDPYAAWMLDHFRRPAVVRMRFDQFMRERRLFATYEGKRYRVTGASRMGDVWLHSDFTKDHGYEKRVDVEKLSAWGAQP